MSNDRERHASWLELFFDLVFVVTISALSKHLIEHHHLLGMTEYLVLFLMLWWLWMGISYYADQFGIHDRSGHIALFLSMFGIMLLNAFIPSAFSQDWKSFGFIYFLMRALLVCLYLRAYLASPVSRQLLKKYIIGFGVAAFLWFFSLFFSRESAFWFWGIAMSIDIATPIYAYLTTINIPAQISHMDERFGLFVIIVLGEMIVNVAHSLRFVHWSTKNVAIAMIGFLIAINFWHQYFSKSHADVIHHALRKKGKTLLLSFVYGYSHLFIFIAIVSFGAGLQLLVDEKTMTYFMGEWIVVVSMVLFAIANKLIRWSATRVKN